MSEPRMDKEWAKWSMWAKNESRVSQEWVKGELRTSQGRAKSEPVEPSEPSESRVSLVSQFEGPEYSAVRCLLFAANLTDVKYRLTSSDTPESLQT